MKWNELVRRISKLYESYDLKRSGIDVEATEAFLKKAFNAKDIKVVANKLSFIIPYIPLKYVKKGDQILPISDKRKGLWNVHITVARIGPRWIIVDIQPERGDHPNWFPDSKWLCTGDITLSNIKLGDLLRHVLSSLEMGTERVDDYSVQKFSDPIANILLFDEE